MNIVFGWLGPQTARLYWGRVLIDVVIVNWNAGSQLSECVESVLTYALDRVAKVIIVDNGSTDRSTDQVINMEGIEVIRAGKNLGFAAACNLGVKAGFSPYLLFLNPDTRVEAQSLTRPLEFMEQPENCDVGICGIQLRNDDDRVSYSCSRFPTLARLVLGALGVEKVPLFRRVGMQMSEWEHDETRLVDQVMGAFFMIRRDLFESLGGFDEQFFVYFEEVDLSFRACKAGWQSMFLADAQAFHAGGGTSRQVKAIRLFYSLRSRLLYGFKHFPRWQGWVLVGITSVIEPLTRTLWCLAQGDIAGVRDTWSAYRMLWRGMGRIVSGDGRFIP
ncbi:glycosyltransferase family 2 protein [Euhalothece natronophila Z-M001]|uniref:Glycosyltransferase family 2 protein n=1 Tax=Euhalothece natronophila Z-M001 TaxID=522448 RepID=A0A5B8NIB9_9CHRO|nr:glycosyltransferase family 2 protein [Euhalothece natronophila]QDZ38667.1 glycosyltransferase family 2 protein [Euhalothece natronophila Z-M001]